MLNRKAFELKWVLKKKIQTRTHSCTIQMYDVTRHVKSKQRLLNLVANQWLSSIIVRLQSHIHVLSLSLYYSVFFSLMYALHIQKSDTYTYKINEYGILLISFLFISCVVFFLLSNFFFSSHLFRILSRIWSFSIVCAG